MSHFYELLSDGTIEPRHFVEMTTKQGLRPTRITDMKKWIKEGRKVASSVTTVLNVLDKPELVNWKVDQHLETVFSLFQNNAIETTDYEGFLRKVKSDTQDRMDLAPKAGTDIHKVLEDYISKDILPENEIERKICFNVEKALGDVTKYKCEQYFYDEALGFAGCADLVSDTFVIDFKSKQTSDKFKAGKMVYAEHSRQLAAYSMAFHGRIVNCANIFVCLEDGQIDFHIHKQEDLENGWLDFKDCLSIYKRGNGV